jgi:hypothetical protein
MKYALTLLTLLFLGSVTPAALAKRPTGEEITKKAKAAKLDKGNSASAMIKGQKVQFTPVEGDQRLSQSELEEGVVLGVLDTEAKGGKLPAGRYNAYAAKDDGDWKVYLESDGRIVQEVRNVKVEKHAGGKAKPEITEGHKQASQLPGEPGQVVAAERALQEGFFCVYVCVWWQCWSWCPF